MGVPVNFAEISNISVLVEVAFQDKGLVPELSFGTHFFQDLIETQIIYAAIFPEKTKVVFRNDFLKNSANILPSLLPEAKDWANVIKVIDLTNGGGQKVSLETDLQNENLSAG